MPRRSWVILALSLVGLVLIAFGYWLWRPAPQLNSYIPTNSHLIIGFGSDYLQGDITDIGQIPLSTWRQQLLTYVTSQISVPADQLQSIIWATDATAGQQTLLVQLRHGLSKKQQQDIRSQIIGKLTPVLSATWREVTIVDAIIIISTEEHYQRPTKTNSLLSNSALASGYVLWDQPWPKSLIALPQLADWKIVSRQSAGQLLFDSRDSMRRFIVRLPVGEKKTLGSVTLPPTANFQLYIAGKTENFTSLRDIVSLQPWYQSFESVIGQKYGLSLPVVLKSFGTNLIFLLNGDQWLSQSSTASLQQLASSLSGYLEPKIQHGKLPDGSVYQELVRSVTQASTTTVSGREVKLWGETSKQLLYQFDDSGLSTLSNSQELMSLALAPQDVKGSWQVCLPSEKLVWSDIVWLQANTGDDGGDFSLLAPPWKAAGLLSGYSDKFQEYIFCLL